MGLRDEETLTPVGYCWEADRVSFSGRLNRGVSLKEMRRAVGVFCAIVVLAALFVDIDAASARAERGVESDIPVSAVTVGDDGWIRYAPQFDAQGISSESGVVGVSGGGPVTVPVDSSRGPDGECLEAGTLPLTSTTGVVYEEEVAFNPSSCASEILVAVLTPAQAAELDGPDSNYVIEDDEMIGEAPTLLSRHGSSLQSSTAATHDRYLKTSWIDPIDITISSQANGMEWSDAAFIRSHVTRKSFKGCVDGNCLDDTYIVSSSSPLTTLSASAGWSRDAHVHFSNLTFALWVEGILGAAGWIACGAPSSSSANFYHEDKVTGYASGSSAYSWSDSKSGACTNLVHHSSSTGASWPW